MTTDFPLDDVKISEVAICRQVESPAHASSGWQVSRDAFSMQVEQVGSFYTVGGAEAEYSVLPGADPGWVRLYLHGQVVVALLHQRGVISFHASSFVHEGQGLMILGETGAGKTSLTVAFAMNGAGFMSDDLTPVVFREDVPLIWSLNRRVKLREDSIEQLEIGGGNLSEAESGTGKKYMHIEKGADEYHRLDVIVKIETGDVNEPVFMNLSAAERFTLLRSEVCSWEILAGMPETEAAYLQQLVKIIEKVHFVKVTRPADIEIRKMHEVVRDYLLSQP
jgi:hypothetical protein